MYEYYEKRNNFNIIVPYNNDQGDILADGKNSKGCSKSCLKSLTDSRKICLTCNYIRWLQPDLPSNTDL